MLGEIQKEKNMSVQLLEKLFSLKGKTALISGGYKESAVCFADTYAEAGADVAIVARIGKPVKRQPEKSPQSSGLEQSESMDVHKTEIVNRVVQEIMDEFGNINILVNSAGVSGSEKPVLQMSDEDMDDVMNVDFRGIFLVSRAVAKRMAERKSGKII